MIVGISNFLLPTPSLPSLLLLLLLLFLCLVAYVFSKLSNRNMYLFCINIRKIRFIHFIATKDEFCVLDFEFRITKIRH